MDSIPSPAPAHCPECAPHLPLRNHWFWGKCIVPRDMTDEQSFFLQKLRLHHQRLHGTGIVCGLDLKAHQNVNCRDRLVTLMPGSAVDCCGHDILVLEQDTIDLHAYAPIASLIAKPDGKPHRLRFCIRYRECPTEEVPVLYDECACDDTRCAPNRILETYGIEVDLDQPPLVQPVLQPRFARVTTLLIAGTQTVALDSAGGRILVLAGSSLLELDATTHALGAPRALSAPGRAMTLAADGSRLDLVFGGDATNDPTLAVLAIGGPVPVSTATQRDAPLAGGDNSAVSLAETTDGRLVAVIESKGGTRLWAAGIPDPTTLAGQSDIGAATHGLALSSDGSTAWLAAPGAATLHKIDLGSSGLSGSTVTLDGGAGFTGQGDNLAVIATTGPDRLAVLDHATPRLHLVDPATGKVEGSVTLDHPPIDLVISPGGHWAFVVEDDGTTGWLQAVNLQVLRQGRKVIAGTPEKLGAKPGHPVLSPDGRRLYVPIQDGVAVFDVTDADCAGLLEGGDCPDCLTPDCLVLATVENWQPGFRLEDIGPTPPDPAQDAANKIARIDNKLERVVLPSTQAIAAAVECLTVIGGGGAPGPAGPPGPPGQDGVNGKDGTNGKDAVDLTLTQICGINWQHAGTVPLQNLLVQFQTEDEFAVAIAFANANFTEPGKVQAADLNDISFSVLMEHVETVDGQLARVCWCALPTSGVVAVQLRQECVPNAGAPKPFSDGTCNGAIYPFPQQAITSELHNRRNVRVPKLAQSVRIKVCVYGSLIRDRKDRALDAIHLPPWLPAHPSGNGIAGGVFESWFTLTP